jgi:NADH dehydrogenase (ubiquinone) 1 alpha subcomplex subunit 5
MKSTTGLCGLEVQPEGRVILTRLYTDMLAKVGEMEPTAPYRVLMTRVLTHRLEILKTTVDVLDIEAKIEDGQIEELIEDAEEELDMLPGYIESQMWQAPKWHTVPVVWSNLKD